MRFIAHDFFSGSPLLIDRELQTMAFYQKSSNGAICNLRNPDCIAVDAKMKRALIQCTRGNYSPYSRKAIDSYIFAYLLTPEESKKCVLKPQKPNDKKIVETDSFCEAVRVMCGFAHNYERDNEHNSEDGAPCERISSLQYCEDFLRENPSPPIPTEKERGSGAR